MKPISLGPNQPPRFFDGGAAIARWRGLPDGDGRAPEDWVASTTPLFGEAEAGLTRLPDGTLLRDAITADPQSWLGDGHAAVCGADPALLVKLLEAGQRLPVHCHPDREFARRHLDCRYGKTEAWVVLEVSGPDPSVHLGFREQVDAAELAAMVEEQRTEAMLAAMNVVPVAPGDTVLVPAGVPHAIGAGVFVLELQEPTDLSVLMEWDGFDVDGRRAGHLDLGYDIALRAVDRSAWDGDRIAELTARRPPRAEAPEGLEVLFPAAADPYFRAERLRPGAGSVRLDPGFSVLAVSAGIGGLATEHGGDLPLRRGDVVLLPYGSGSAAVSGEVEVIRCRPPAFGRTAPLAPAMRRERG